MMSVDGKYMYILALSILGFGTGGPGYRKRERIISHSRSVPLNVLIIIMLACT
jgi:hypothetical protein